MDTPLEAAAMDTKECNGSKPVEGEEEAPANILHSPGGSIII